MNEYEALVDETVRTKHTVMLVGGLDTGKSTLSRRLLEAAVAAGRPAAYVDADLGQKTVGPPATMAMRVVRSADDLAPGRFEEADALAFVGATSPQGHMVQVISAVASLHRRALEAGAELVVVDTSGMVSGVYGQILKYHKVEMVRPDL
ncbi:MAG TPA: Clp1/GlmU family protein, partial [Actinomycetota bacterium]|nr:Clp1/GlmU family protein [Actinomycetota bacterium]